LDDHARRSAGDRGGDYHYVVPDIGGAAIGYRRRVRQHSVYTLGTPKQVAWLTADEYTTLGLRITADGQVSAFHIPTGSFVTASDLEFAATATAVAGVVTREQVAFGFADGTVRFGTFNFEPGVITADNLPKGLQQLNESDSLGGSTIYRELNTGDYRTITPVWTIAMPSRFRNTRSSQSITGSAVRSSGPRARS
jgi:hypothetical protein